MKTLSIAVLQAQSQGVFQAFSGLYCPVEYGLANVFSAVFDPLLFKFHLRMSKSDAELRDVFAFQCDCGRSWQCAVPLGNTCHFLGQTHLSTFTVFQQFYLTEIRAVKNGDFVYDFLKKNDTN
jgi:hypothetical protein